MSDSSFVEVDPLLLSPKPASEPRKPSSRLCYLALVGALSAGVAVYFSAKNDAVVMRKNVNELNRHPLNSADSAYSYAFDTPSGRSISVLVHP